MSSDVEAAVGQPRLVAVAGAVVRLITGRGRSGGGAPIRTRVRTLLRGMREQGDVVRDFELEETEGSFLVRLGG